MYNYEVFFKYKDNFDYAQMGREIREKGKFSTLQIFPSFLKFMKKRNILDSEDWPNLYRFPLPAISNAIFQLFFPVIKANIIQSSFFLFLSTFLIYWIMTFKTNELLAFFSSLYFFLDGLIYGYSGLSETLTIFLLILLVWFLFFYKGKPEKESVFVGLSVGLLFLARSTFGYLLFVVPFFLLAKINRLKIIFFFYLFSFLIISPWAIRNYIVAGSPFFSFSNIRGLGYFKKDPALFINTPISLNKIIVKNKKKILKRFLMNIKKFFKLKVFSPFNIFFFLVLFMIIISFLNKRFMRFLKDKNFYTLFIFFVILYILNFFIYSFFILDIRYFYYFKVFIIMTFFILFYTLFRQNRLFYVLGIVFFTVFSLYLINNVEKNISRVKHNKYINEKKRIFFVLESNNLFKKKKNIIIMSNISYMTALALNKKSIRLPYNPKDIEKINLKFIKIDYIVIHKKLGENYLKYRKELKSIIFFNYFRKLSFNDPNLLVYKRI